MRRDRPDPAVLALLDPGPRPLEWHRAHGWEASWPGAMEALEFELAALAVRVKLYGVPVMSRLQRAVTRSQLTRPELGDYSK